MAEILIYWIILLPEFRVLGSAAWIFIKMQFVVGLTLLVSDLISLRSSKLKPFFLILLMVVFEFSWAVINNKEIKKTHLIFLSRIIEWYVENMAEKLGRGSWIHALAIMLKAQISSRSMGGEVSRWCCWLFFHWSFLTLASSSVKSWSW